MAKESVLRFRLDDELLAKWYAYCERNGINSSDELRKIIKTAVWVDETEKNKGKAS